MVGGWLWWFSPVWVVWFHSWEHGSEGLSLSPGFPTQSLAWSLDNCLLLNFYVYNLRVMVVTMHLSSYHPWKGWMEVSLKHLAQCLAWSRGQAHIWGTDKGHDHRVPNVVQKTYPNSSSNSILWSSLPLWEWGRMPQDIFYKEDALRTHGFFWFWLNGHLIRIWLALFWGGNALTC